MSEQNSLPGISRANHANLGRDFERELETVNDFYRLKGIADIRKIPHVWTFISAREYLKLKTKLPGSMLARTEDGRFLQRTKSDVDFVGGGKIGNTPFFIAFDAKTVSGGRFPLSNLANHQLENLLVRVRCGSIAGLMIKFSDANRVFFVPAEYLLRRADLLLIATIGKRRAATGTASLSINDLETHGIEILPEKGLLNYLVKIIKTSL